MTRFSEAERLARLRLIRSDGIGPVGFAQLLRKFPSAEEAAESRPGRGEPFPTEAALAEIAQAEASGAVHVFLGEADYPPLLAELADAPPVLLACGDLTLAQRECVAIVGARNASAAGMRLAEEIAAGLGAAGRIVISGMARGIDGAAHTGALRTGTIACVAGGIDIFYPPEHAALQQRVLESGLVVSEMPCGVEPMARHFPRRNRLIAGIARGLVVVEAAMGSGSLISARIAGDAGRDVMAVPGHPRDPRARGGNALIKEGAVLVENAADILAVLAPFALEEPAPRRRRQVRDTMDLFDAAPADEMPDDALLDLLSATPVAIDELVRRSGLSPSQVQARLTGLEIEGLLVRHAGGRVAVAQNIQQA
ncbi:MAG: DNA-processing protein DprA [Sphingomonadaceae bacterium]